MICYCDFFLFKDLSAVCALLHSEACFCACCFLRSFPVACLVTCSRNFIFFNITTGWTDSFPKALFLTCCILCYFPVTVTMSIYTVLSVLNGYCVIAVFCITDSNIVLSGLILISIGFSLDIQSLVIALNYLIAWNSKWCRNKIFTDITCQIFRCYSYLTLCYLYCFTADKCIVVRSCNAVPYCVFSCILKYRAYCLTSFCKFCFRCKFLVRIVYLCALNWSWNRYAVFSTIIFTFKSCRIYIKVSI